jgi:hypothetical protein
MVYSMSLTINNISGSIEIGDELPKINLNFKNLDNYTFALNLGSSNYFDPFRDFYVTNRENFNYMITMVQQNSARWQSVSTLVTRNSSAWIKPIVYIHPEIVSFPVSNSEIDKITNSFKVLYPILNVNNPPNYVENQKAIIYYYTKDIKDIVDDNDIINSNFAECVSKGLIQVAISCRNNVSGTAKCNGNSWNCAGRCSSSCNPSVSLNCVYNNRTNKQSRYMTARLRGIFSDRYERNIRGLVLTVKNCEWTFERNLT